MITVLCVAMEFLLALLYIGENMTPYYTSNTLAGDDRALGSMLCATLGRMRGVADAAIRNIGQTGASNAKASSQCLPIICSTNTAGQTVGSVTTSFLGTSTGTSCISMQYTKAPLEEQSSLICVRIEL